MIGPVACPTFPNTDQFISCTKSRQKFGADFSLQTCGMDWSWVRLVLAKSQTDPTFVSQTVLVPRTLFEEIEWSYEGS
jgi:hypothetical protein